MRSALKQGLAGAGAWIVVGTVLRVGLGNWAVAGAVAQSLPGAVGFGAVYTYLAHRRRD